MKMDMNLNVFKVLLILAAMVQLISSQNCPKMTLKNGRVRIRSRGRMAQFRCRRGFSRIGERFAVCLKTGIWSQKPPLCVGRGCPAVSKIPNMSVEKLSRGGILKFKCIKGRRVGPESIYCDGTEWSSPPPKCQDGMSLGCDFETKDLCGWNQDDSDNFDWTWHKGNTPTQDTGPSVDHTTNSSKGHYIFMESSSPKKLGHKARLISPSFKPDEIAGVCLEFFYHMLGPNDPGFVGDLDVFTVPSRLSSLNGLDSKTAFFHVEGNQGDVWHKADLDIPRQSEPFVLVFQGTRQRGWNGDVALDDILLYNCSDRSTTLQTTTTSVITMPTAEFTHEKTSSSISLPVSSRGISSQGFTSGTTTTSTTTKRPTSTTETSTTIPTTTTTPTTARTTTTTSTTTTTPTTTTITTTTPPTTTTTTTTPTTTTTTTTTTISTTTPPTTTPTSTTETTTTTPTAITTPTTTTSTTTPITTTKLTTVTTTTRATSTTTSTTATTTIATTTHPSEMTETTTPTIKSTSIVKKSTEHKDDTPFPPPNTSMVLSESSSSASTTISPTMETTATDESSTRSSLSVTTTFEKSSGLHTSPSFWSNETAGSSTQRLSSPDDINKTDGHVSGETFSNVKTTTNSFSPKDNNIGNHDDNNEDEGTSKNVDVGKVKEGDDNSSFTELLPLIIGVVVAVLVGAIVIGVLAWMWSKKQRQKEEKDMEDQMNIIAEYVETNMMS